MLPRTHMVRRPWGWRYKFLDAQIVHEGPGTVRLGGNDVTVWASESFTRVFSCDETLFRGNLVECGQCHLCKQTSAKIHMTSRRSICISASLARLLLYSISCRTKGRCREICKLSPVIRCDKNYPLSTEWTDMTLFLSCLKKKDNADFVLLPHQP